MVAFFFRFEIDQYICFCTLYCLYVQTLPLPESPMDEVKYNMLGTKNKNKIKLKNLNFFKKNKSKKFYLI